MPHVPELTPTDFSRRWAGGTEPVILLDVREPSELALASLPNALHIPMAEIPQRIDEIDARLPVVVMCHGGGRSRRVAEFLAANGFGEVYNLAGGIDAWSQEVDARVPRY